MRMNGKPYQLNCYHYRMPANDPPMKFEEIRRLIITALFADDTLSEQLVLKGGNALTIVHKIGDRTSLDLDFSMAEDFSDLDAAKQRISRNAKGPVRFRGICPY